MKPLTAIYAQFNDLCFAWNAFLEFISSQTWHHNPDHRHGVPYHNAVVRQQLSGNRNLSAVPTRWIFGDG